MYTMQKLTPKQKAFINEYLIDLNATQAAIRAGYSPKTAYRTGCDNLKKPHIKTELDRLMQERGERALITADEVIVGIRDIAYDNKARHNDKLKAFELLGKHLALFTDRIEHSGEVDIVVELIDDHED